MKNIIAKIKSAYPVSDESIRQLAACLTPMRFPKKHLLIQEGRFCQYAYFIETGMTRSFWIVEGEEITTSFAWEGSIVFSMDELYYHKKSEEYVETLEAVEAYRIRLDDLTRLLETNLELCNWGRVIHQNEYRRLHRSHRERLTLPAQARYEEFVRQFPEVCRRVNLGYIASYLGITISTLSRLRARRAKASACNRF